MHSLPWKTSTRDVCFISKTSQNDSLQFIINIIKDINVSAEYVNIYAYYGTYNGAVAIGITDTYNVYDLVVMAEYRVGDVTLYNYAESDIRIWVKLQD